MTVFRYVSSKKWANNKLNKNILNSWSLPQRTAEGAVSSSNNAINALDQNLPIMGKVYDIPLINNHGGRNSPPQKINTITW